MNRTLPFTPRPQVGESPLSVLRRGALGNHHGSTIRFVHSVNPDLDHSATALGAVARNPDRLSTTFEAIGLSPEDTARVAYDRTGNARADDVEWNGLRVAVGDLQFRRSKLCMACYLENGFAVSQWDHQAAIACAKHQVLLDDACPCCGKAWTPTTDPLACGCDPAGMVARQQECGGEVASLLDRLVKAGDQAGLDILRGAWSVLQSWLAFGLEVSRSFAANALGDLSSCRWPAITHAPATAGSVLMHPRVALAPLLASPSTACTDAAHRLLSVEAPDMLANRIDDHWWPATTAMTVLGAKRVPFDKLVRAGHLVRHADGRYSAAEINELLWRVKGCRDGSETQKPLSAHRAGPQPQSLAALVGKIKAGVITSYYCPADNGLDGLLCASEGRPVTFEAGLGLKEVATRLGTNTESVRSAIHLRLLAGTKGTPRSAVEWTVSVDSLRAFEADYVFASSIARANGVSALTIANRLRSAGLEPVSGPDVDGGITYVFKRRQLAQIELVSALNGSYRSRAGRKSGGTVAGQADFMSSRECAAVLDISVRQLREVVRGGWIAPVAVLWRGRVFDGDTVRSLKRLLDEDYVPISAAANSMGQSLAEFRRTWVYTQVIPVYAFVSRTLVKSEDLMRIQSMWQEHGTSTSIGRALNRPRWLCPNLEKMARMPAPTIIGAGSSKVRLYPRRNQLLKKYDMT